MGDKFTIDEDTALSRERSAVARTAHRWRKRMKVKQLKIDSLEESVKHLRNDLERQRLKLLESERQITALRSHASYAAREAMRESTFHGSPARDYYR